MSFDTVIDKEQLEKAMKATADAIRSKTERSELIAWNPDQGFADAVSGLSVEEMIRHVDIPEYVKAEALRVADQVRSVRTDDSIVFLAMSDNHYYGAQKDTDQYADTDGIQTDVSNLHAAMAAKILAYGMNFDFMAQLGDATWGNDRTAPAILQSQASGLTALLKEAHKDIPCFHAIGNHDTGIYHHYSMLDKGNTGVYTESGDSLYNMFTALSESEDTVFGGVANGGYCYRDFPDKRLRVFLLNTSEALTVQQTESKSMLGSQLKWFADALLNLNVKSDAASWSFLVLSHYPADFSPAMSLSELLKAYVESGSITVSIEDGTSATVDFASKNQAKFVAQFHGHLHNFLAVKLSTRPNNGNGVAYDAWRICIPNAQYGRENTYSDSNGIVLHADADYNKTPNTAKDTSFVVNVIEPAEQKIYSFCYGAGRDRVIGYGATVYHSIESILSNLTMLDAAVSVEDGTPFKATLTPDAHCSITSVIVTMGGVDVTSSTYEDGVISIAQVTGNVVITASAKIAYACTNQIPISTDIDGNIYNGVGYQEKTYIGSTGNNSVNNSTSTTGFIPINLGDVIRIQGMSFNKGESNHRIGFYDADKQWLFNVQANSSWYMDTSFGGVLDDNNDYVQFTLMAVSNIQGAAYIRMSGANISESSIITVNEEIKYIDEVSVLTGGTEDGASQE